MLLYNEINKDSCYEEIFEGLLKVFSAAGQQGRKDITDVCRKLFSDPEISAAEERLCERLWRSHP